MTINNRDTEQDIGPWYKQFWAWFILAPIITVMLAWIPFMAIVLKSADDVVVDNYYKEGRMYNLRMDEDKLAATLGIAGELFIDLEVGDVMVTLSADDADYALPAALTLYLDHPVEADNDLVITLNQTYPGRYQGEIPHRINYHWYVRITPAAAAVEESTESPAASISGEPGRHWRVVSEMDFSQSPRMTFGASE